MRYRSLLLAGTFAVAAPASIAGAQSMNRMSNSVAPVPAATQNVRKGMYVGGAIGYGSAGISCTGCSSDRENGLAGYFRIGGTVNPHLRLGIESDGWMKTVQGVDEQIGFLTADAYLYPSVSNNLWIKGGFGLAMSKESDATDEMKATGTGVAAGIGYDWAPGGGSFAIVPYASYHRQLSGNMKFNGEDTGVSPNTNVFQVGFGIGYRH
jgi:outer membrane protein with beta-barrel domain